jgi:hypothetical protein
MNSFDGNNRGSWNISSYRVPAFPVIISRLSPLTVIPHAKGHWYSMRITVKGDNLDIMTGKAGTL